MTAVASAARDYIDGCVRRSEFPDRALLTVALGLKGADLERFVNAEIGAYCLRRHEPTGTFEHAHKHHARRKK